VAEFNVLEFLNERIIDLIREYNTAIMNARSAPELLEQLSRLVLLRSELKKILTRTKQVKNHLVMPPIEFGNLDSVYRRIDDLARELADMPRASPRRLELIEEIARLSIFAE